MGLQWDYWHLQLSHAKMRKNGTVENRIYFSEAASMKTQVVSLEDGGTTSAVTVRLVRAIDTDVKVTIGLDEAYLNDYNKSNETEYRVLDSDKLRFQKKQSLRPDRLVQNLSLLKLRILKLLACNMQYL